MVEARTQAFFQRTFTLGYGFCPSILSRQVGSARASVRKKRARGLRHFYFSVQKSLSPQGRKEETRKTAWKKKKRTHVSSLFTITIPFFFFTIHFHLSSTTTTLLLHPSFPSRAPTPEELCPPAGVPGCPSLLHA